jgi:hypothetical protein
MKKLLLIVAILALASSAQAAPVLIGWPGTGSNCFPFGCSGSPGTRYQQVYAASDFSGIITITGVTFFDSFYPGTFNEADYTLSLSTTSKAVNGLDTVMGNNVGGDNTLIFSGHLSGTVPASFTLSGGVFTYNPFSGNLLVDIMLTNHVGGGSAYLDARNGDAGGLFSRMQDFGSAFENWGLVTQFETAARVPDVGSSLLLLGMGLAGLRAFRKR